MLMSAWRQTILFARRELFASTQMVATIATAHMVTYTELMTNMNMSVHATTKENSRQPFLFLQV